MSEQHDTMIEPTTEPTGHHGTDTERSGSVQHVTVEHDDDIAVCTMFPQEIDEDDISSQWITATGDSFDALETWR